MLSVRPRVQKSIRRPASKLMLFFVAFVLSVHVHAAGADLAAALLAAHVVMHMMANRAHFRRAAISRAADRTFVHMILDLRLNPSIIFFR